MFLIYDFAVVGGDRRLFYLANFLEEKNFKVVGFGLVNLKNEAYKFSVASSLNEALLNSKNWVLPLPVSRDGVFLNFSNEKAGSRVELSELLKLAKKSTGIFGGGFSSNFFSALNCRTNFIYDFLKNESFAVFNAGLTAQAAVAQAVLKSAVDCGSRCCLVLGFGRCGKLLALKLKSFCSRVVVCMRNETEMAWARALGLEVLKLSNFENGLNLKQFNFIFNTIPKKLLTGPLLEKLNQEVFIFDITPNGLDQTELKEKSINFLISLQIPGLFKFKSAAKHLANLIVKVLKAQKM